MGGPARPREQPSVLVTDGCHGYPGRLATSLSADSVRELLKQ